MLKLCNFNPRSPCGERLKGDWMHDFPHIFQPSLPLRGATYPGDRVLGDIAFQPSLPLRGATYREAGRFHHRGISTLAPLAGSDVRRERAMLKSRYFNPRSPCGERHETECSKGWKSPISTLAPRAGSDTRPRCSRTVTPNFNPRSPCGERPLYIVMDAPLIARCSDSRALAPSTTYIPLSKYTWNRCEPTGRTLIATSSHLCACE